MFDIGGVFKSALQGIGGAVGGPLGAMAGGMIADFFNQTVTSQLDSLLADAGLPIDTQALFSGNYQQAFRSALGG